MAGNLAGAEAAIRSLDGHRGRNLEGLGRFLVRAESVGSSWIEGLAVPALLEDLIDYVNSDEHPALLQAALDLWAVTDAALVVARLNRVTPLRLFRRGAPGDSRHMAYPSPPMTEEEWFPLGGPHPTTVSPTLMVARPPAQIPEGRDEDVLWFIDVADVVAMCGDMVLSPHIRVPWERWLRGHGLLD